MSQTITRKALPIAALAASLAASASATTFVSSDFSTFTDGALVGQSSWVQYAAPVTAPITVTSGQVTLPSILNASATTDNQDAILPLASTIAAPTSGSTTYYFGLQLSVSAAGSTPSYFAALNTTNATSGGFGNIRIGAKDNGDSTFSFAARVTGQAGYPWVYGTSLTYGTTYNVIAAITLNSATTQDDVINLYVLPSTSELILGSVYATSQYTTGAGTDPTGLGAIAISQFANATTHQSAVSFGKVILADSASDVTGFLAVPEPSSFAALAGVAVLGASTLRRRKRSL